MAGQGHRGGYMNKKDVKLPDAFKCRVCKKDKSFKLFSKRELGDYQGRVAGGAGPTDPACYFLCCRGCAGAPDPELKCHGPCGLWKCTDDFSKNQRQEEEAWCLLCVFWKLANDPGTSGGAAVPVPRAAPSAEPANYLAQEYIRGANWDSDEEEPEVGGTFRQGMTTASDSEALIDVTAPSTSEVTSSAQTVQNRWFKGRQVSQQMSTTSVSTYGHGQQAGFNVGGFAAGGAQLGTQVVPAQVSRSRLRFPKAPPKPLDPNLLPFKTMPQASTQPTSLDDQDRDHL